jgi:hypothetical protein
MSVQTRAPAGAGSTARTAVRALLGLLVVGEVVVGVWAQVFPVSFHEDFPFGLGWVRLLPPYNEHLVRDVGGLSLALVVVLGAALLRTDRFTVRVAALAGAVFAVPHTVFHALHMAHFPVVDAVAQTVGNIVMCAAVLLLWVLAARLPGAERGGA